MCSCFCHITQFPSCALATSLILTLFLIFDVLLKSKYREGQMRFVTRAHLLIVLFRLRLSLLTKDWPTPSSGLSLGQMNSG